MPDLTPVRGSGLATSARLSLGDPRPALSTQNHLRFQLDHALARDAVHTPLDITLLRDGLAARNLASSTLRTNAPNRKTYLRRPDLGRTLHPASIARLRESVILSRGSQIPREPQPAVSESPSPAETDRNLLPNEALPHIAIILADGLSAVAIERHALPLLDELLPLLSDCNLAAVTIVTDARVAIADPIGQLLGTKLTVLLIGERPGLSCADSLGCYITWDPRPGKTDAERNCISNIHANGLSYAEAAARIAHYLREARRLQTTGIALKDPPAITLLDSGC